MENYFLGEVLVKFRMIFYGFDLRRSGKVRVKDIARSINVVRSDLSESNFYVIIGQAMGLDPNNLPTSWVTFSEFIVMIAVINEHFVSKDEMIRIFRVFDNDGDGFISPTELRNLLSALGDHVTDDDVQEMILEADLDGDGLVSLREFIQVMAPPSAGVVATRGRHFDGATFLTNIGRGSIDAEEGSTCSGLDERTSSEVSDPTVRGLDPHVANVSTSSSSSAKRKLSFKQRGKNIISWLKGR